MDETYCSVVVDHSEQCCLPVQGSPQSDNETDDRDPDDEKDIQPVDMLVPVC